MTQYGFFIDTSRCTGCNACVIACKQWKEIPPGPAKPIRVYQWEKGNFPDIDLRVLPIMCSHCERPKCLDACKNGAISKDEEYGAVLVDPDKCRGDRNCFEACPYGAPQFLSDGDDEKMLKCDMCLDRLREGNAPICVLSCSLRALDFGPLDELRGKYKDAGVYIVEGEPPCAAACPAGMDIQKYMNLAAEGKYDEAADLCRETTPFIGSLGRVCTRPCEIDCFLGRFDDASAIREVKRFISDRSAEGICQSAASNGRKIAIIGGGPTGLSCAWQLVRKGYAVTVFDREAEMGGMMRYGIPAYRLPKDVLDREIELFRRAGVNMLNDHAVSNISELSGYDAVFVATGAGEGLSLPVPGASADGIQSAVDFLRSVNKGETKTVTKETVVVGGGSVAVDAARTALRLGAPRVHIVCLEGSDYSGENPMPAQEDEVSQAQEEGIVIHDQRGIHSFRVEGGVVRAVRCIDCIAIRDADGKFAPRYAGGEPTLELPAGLALLAIGQRASEAALVNGLPLTEDNRIDINGSFQTWNPCVFAGGDLLTGTSDIISSVAAGNAAAESIHCFCEGKPLPERKIPESARLRLEKKSLAPPCRPAGERARDFTEVCPGFGEEDCQTQSARCLHCGTLMPSVLIRRETPKRNVVPWDKHEALRLWAKRHADNGEELPDVFSDINEILFPEAPSVFFRGKLMLRASSSADKLLYTMDDE